jgi:glycerol kinase
MKTSRKKYLLCIDQSTSGTKAVLFGHKAEFIARANAEHRQYYPKPGWVEHDPEEIFNNTLRVLAKVIKQASLEKGNIACISLTNQRETVLAWDKNTGKPLTNAVVWQCMRGEQQCNRLKAAGHEPMIRQKTGLLIDPYFSASGLSWILNSSDDIKRKVRKGEVLAGTIDSWLIWKLTRGKTHATDYTNACRTLLFNIHTLEWDEKICNLFNIPVSILPEPKPSDELFGYTDAEGLFDKKIPISGVLGDSHGALFGQRCYQTGLSKVTYGTGSSVMMNIGNKAKEAPAGLVTSIGYGLKDQMTYVFEGNIHSTGATIKWLTDSLHLISTAAESEKLASSVNTTHGVYFVPAFAGLGAPYWDNQARATISGITGGTTKAHIVRAGLESIAYQVKDLLDLMVLKAGISLREIRADGGPTRNNFLMQFQADMLNAPITISHIEEASALGAVLAGGLGTGLWHTMTEIEKLYKAKETIKPLMDEKSRNILYSGWKQAVKQLLK